MGIYVHIKNGGTKGSIVDVNQIPTPQAGELVFGFGAAVQQYRKVEIVNTMRRLLDAARDRRYPDTGASGANHYSMLVGLAGTHKMVSESDLLEKPFSVSLIVSDTFLSKALNISRASHLIDTAARTCADMLREMMATSVDAGEYNDYDWNLVTFGGDDWLNNPTNLGLGSATTLTLAVVFEAPNPLSAQNILGMATAAPFAMLELAANGSMLFRTPTDLATSGHVNALIVPDGTIEPGQVYTVHVAANAAGATAGDRLKCWVNSILMPTPVAAWVGAAAWPAPTAWRIGASTAGALPFTGKLGLVWMDFGQLITNPAAFYPANDLGAQLAAPGARPAIGFGGSQTPANWNAGTNLGDGTGTWTMTGAVT